MRKFIIDTDVASDDAIAIVMALNEPSVKVVAITTVSGCVEVEDATRNALISIEHSDTYQPPVYEGIGDAFVRDKVRTGHVHGEDGLGDQGYKASLRKAEGHGVLRMIEIVKNTEEIEIVALGPLTNVAAAIVMDRQIMSRVKHIFLMGGAYLGGNANPNAEYNIFTDPEAANVVFKSGIPITMSPIENCMENLLLKDEYEQLDSLSPIGHFCVSVSAKLTEHIMRLTGVNAFSMPDPMAMALALYDDCSDKMVSCHVDIETGCNVNYGRSSCDIQNKFKNTPNANVCITFNNDNFKKHLWKTCKR